MKRRLANNRSPRWAFMERFEIPNLDDPSETYLTRWRIVQTPWCALYLHRMDGPDSRPTLHDHPFNFVSIILKGGYLERHSPNATLQSTPRRWLAGSWHRMRAEEAHYIMRLDRVPTWTLLLVGRRRREWGYIEAAALGNGFELANWVHYLEHPYNAEFEHAMAARREAA